MTKPSYLIVTALMALVSTSASGRCQTKESPSDKQDQGVLAKSSDGRSLNLDFETGTLQDWTAEGVTFATLPIKGDVIKPRRGYMQSGHQGNYWIGTGEAKGDAAQGTIVSVPFEVTHPWATFLIGGGAQQETCVEIERRDTKAVIHRSSGIDVEDMQRVAVDLTSHLGKEIRLRIVDRSSAGWGHINFDDFRFHAKKPAIKPVVTKFDDRYAEAKRAMKSGDYAKAKRLLQETLVALERNYSRSESGTNRLSFGDALFDWAELCLMVDPIAGKAVLQNAIVMCRRSYGPGTPEVAETRILAARYGMLEDLHSTAYTHAEAAAQILRNSRKDLLPIREAVFGISHSFSTLPFQPANESKVVLHFANRLKKPVTLVWFDGKLRNPCGILQANAETEHSTLSRQIWLAIDEAGKVVFACRAPDVSERIEIGSQTAEAGFSYSDLASRSLDLRAKLALRTDKLDEAKASFDEAANIRRQYLPAHHPEFARWLTNAATIERRKKNWAMALQHALQAKSLWDQACPDEAPFDSYRTEQEIGLAEWMLGKKASAEAHFTLAQKLHGRASLDHADADPRTHHELALAFRGMGEPEEAENHARRAAEESLRFLTARANRRASALLSNFDSIMDCMGTYLAFARESKRKPAEIYETAVHWKGAVWERSMDTKRAWKALRETDVEARDLLNKIDDACREMIASQLAAPSEATAAQHRKRTTSLYQAWWKIGEDLHPKTVEYRRNHPEAPIPIGALQDLLPPDAALVEYVTYYEPSEHGPPRWKLAAFVSTNEGIRYAELGFLAPLVPTLAEFQAQLQRGRAATGPKAAGSLLREAIWSPIERHLKRRKTILVAPDLQLCQLTFSALPGSDGKQYLLEDYAFVQVASTKELIRTLRTPAWKPGSGSQLLCFGDIDFGSPSDTTAQKIAAQPLGVLGFTGPFGQLPGTRLEVDAIEKILKQAIPTANARVLRGKQATASAFREYAPKCEMLHLATHGFSVGSKGGVHYLGTTGVIFAGVNDVAHETHGIVTALEMAYIDLSNIRLAVLSACETGLGYQSLPGDGIQGPHRPLQTSGARSVIVSHWKVDDEATRLLMERFYENLFAKKLSVLESLRQSQLWLMRDGKSAMSESTLRGIARLYPRDPEAASDNRLPPSLWAPFVIHGDWR